MHNLAEGNHTILGSNLYNQKPISLSIAAKKGFHCHRGIEFCYIHSGAGTCIIGENSYQLKENTLLFFKPFQVHGFFPDANCVFSRSIVVADMVLLLHASVAFPKIKKFVSYLHSETSQMQCFEDKEGGIENIIRTADIYARKLAGGLPAEDGILLCQGILKILEHERENLQNGIKHEIEPQSQSGTEYILALIKWVDDNMGEEYSLDIVSKHMGISKYYLTRLFRKHMGITISQYIQERRLREAKILLYTSHLPVTDIAHKTGFSNLSYFCQVFRANTGTTPNEFRADNLDKLA